MRRGDDGSVQLDCGKLGGVSERLIITYEQNGRVTGRSALPTQTNDDAPLDDRVLEARNTVFSQELWYELTREARTLAPYDVRPEGSRLVCYLDATTKVTLELVPLGSAATSDQDLPGSIITEAMSLAMHILLSHAHRNNELMRTRPMPPHINRSKGQQTYALLRPFIARWMCIHNVHACTRYVGTLVQTLRKAGLRASFTLKTPRTSRSDPLSRGPNQASGSQSFVRHALQPQDFNIKVTIVPDVTFIIRGRTFVFPVTATYYHVYIPHKSPMANVCAPYKDGYPDLEALADYLRVLTVRTIVWHYLGILKNDLGRTDWTQGVRGTSICDADQEVREVRFAINHIGIRPTLVVVSTSLTNGRPDSKRYVWETVGESCPSSLHNVVGQSINVVLP